tara:strand:- start:321 stop:521 length:201 start_codon:yes stop_codon:yes gene_type:complete
MEFEIREEQIIRHSNGGVEVKEIVIARRSKDQIKEIYHDLGIGYRRNCNKDEDFSGDRIHSIVRVK